ncbi:integrin beta-PS-like [Paramacrobiotus metropolitanus]|uniref:integrin beta-PS-like n=1 Tax=Paramacrobiotus metropolitanus TaxID=2943436 RepID=UPI002445A237|nr:integrin beta-PS-like [Paramacrobiotus metropolitanus]
MRNANKPTNTVLHTHAPLSCCVPRSVPFHFKLSAKKTKMMLPNWPYRLTVLWIIFYSHYCLAQAPASSNLCTPYESCGACIQAHPGCAWCEQEDFTPYVSRCDLPSVLLEKKCSNAKIVEPQNVQDRYVDNPPSEEIQIAPQKVSMKMRPRSTMSLTVKFRQTRRPVDLYYLMDLSYSMLDDKVKIASLGRTLAEEMNNLTTNFRLGFGSFVDKTLMPYISIVPKKVVEPCPSCAAPYGYIHHMTLSEEAHEFETRVNDAQISGNLDAPEGGFDAMMQAIVCKKEVGWRDNSRRLLVLSTDAAFHSAGDGKLGGVVNRNDELCHLVPKANGELQYSESTVQDYPSVSQLAKVAAENDINLIFAVTEAEHEDYERLCALIKGCVTGQLATDSSNVVELIKDQYNKITESVQLEDNAPSEFVKLTYYSSCMKAAGAPRDKTKECKGLRIGSEVEWRVDIEIVGVPKGPGPHRFPFRISPVASNEETFVELEIIATCNCDKAEMQVTPENAAQCSFNGTYSCGVCSCMPGTFGRSCECNADTVPGDDKNIGCRADNTSAVLCSGRGQCVCGECQCDPMQSVNEVISGKHCECDNFSCDRHQGAVCGGPDHGTCECKTCVCKAGWTGQACECEESTDACRSPNGKLCSGRGQCVCGRCACDSEEYSGATCELCPTCPSPCDTFRPCAQCRGFETGELADRNQCAANCSVYNITLVKVAEADLPGETACLGRDASDDCTFYFSYYGTEPTSIEVQRDKVCPAPVQAMPIILGVVVGIVLIGLLLLCLWKCIVTIYDRRQYKKWRDEVESSKWQSRAEWNYESENPIYQKPVQTYKNPIYEKAPPEGYR